jgi:lysophospholipase L1-like esterase
MNYSPFILKGICLVLSLGLSAYTLLPPPLTVYLIGDSTMSVKEKKYYPETGWGMPFAHFFQENVTVDNRAMNGRSTGSFLAENRWQPVAASLRPGDYVLIQFGHNDEVKTKKTYTTEEEFQENLTRFVRETRSKQAQPVLITPVARRAFNEQGQLEDTHALYSQLVRKVAQAHQVPLIDLDQKSQQLLTDMGVENSKLLYLHLAPGEHPNYPQGKVDNTHFSELGARKMAQLVLAEIKALGLDLADHVVKPQ